MASYGTDLENQLPGPRALGTLTSNLATWDMSGVTTFKLPAGTTINGSSLTALGVVTSTSANALTAGPAGATNPSFNVDASTASAATGLNVKSAAAAGGLAVTVVSSGTNEALTIDAKGSGTITIAGTSTGAITLGQAVTITTGALTVTSGNVTMTSGNLLLSAGTATVTSANAKALAVGLAGATTPAFSVDASTASQAAGLNVKGAATGGTVAVVAIDSGSNTAVTIDGKGTGVLKLNSVSATAGLVTIGNSTSLLGAVVNGPIQVNNKTAAINATATATAAQVATGYITSTSAAATTITLPTGTLLGTQLGAVQGTIFDLTIDNTAGANTVTIAVAVNGILSALAAAEAAGSGLLTVPSGVTGQGVFRLMFSSATAYTFTRIA